MGIAKQSFVIVSVVALRVLGDIEAETLQE